MKLLEVKWSYKTMDAWQVEILEFVHAIILRWNERSLPENQHLLQNLILLCGRQVGKSEIMAKCIADVLLNIPNIKLLIVSGVERQASGLYNKVLRYIEDSHPSKLGDGEDKPLRTIFKLKNGSQLITEPVGLDGSGARQHTLHGLIIEEMQLVPEDAFAALTPMGLTTNMFMWMLGTAWSTEGYVYERLSDPDFKLVRVNSEQIAELRPEPQKTIMLKHLENERKRLGEAQYAQEYLAIPAANVRQIFPDKLIAKVMTATRPERIDSANEYICGLDPAGLGEDEGSISIFDDRKKFVQVEHEITKKLYTTETTARILTLENKYNFKKIYVDDGGVGFGVFSELLNSDETKYKTIALNNSARPLDYKEEKRKKILGEDMIFNLLTMMERGEIELLKDTEIRESLKSYKFEYHEKTKKLIISSNYNHPVQSIMRAAWHKQQKDLKLSVHSIKV